MSLFPWKPLRLSFDLEKQIDEMFSELIHQPWGRERVQNWQPDIDVHEIQDAYLLQVDLPGVFPQEIKLTVEGDWLTISGERRSTGLVESAHGIVLERRHGKFSRRIPLQHAVDVEKIECRYEEGIYYVRLPKKD